MDETTARHACLLLANPRGDLDAAEIVERAEVLFEFMTRHWVSMPGGAPESGWVERPEKGL